MTLMDHKGSPELTKLQEPSACSRHLILVWHGVLASMKLASVAAA